MGGAMPTMSQAGVYSATRHYLQAIKDAGTDNGPKVAERMKATPVNDMLAHGGRLREDGLMVHDLYLVQVKTPADSKYPWDYYSILRTIPGDQAFKTLAASGCPLVQP
jgi:branched-chain amino acid transport system substrate-binding protein